jgi:serine/threonine protein kinase
LLVGIDDYLHVDRITSLQFAARDATAMRDVLTDSDIGNFPEDDVLLLTGPAAGRDEIMRRLAKWLPEKAQGAELAVLYFAGHGLVHRFGPKDEGFLLPHDADPDDPITRGVAMSDVHRCIEGLTAGAVVVCLDCCHAGRIVPRSGTSVRTVARDLEFRPAVLQEFAGQGRFLLASCDEGQKSLECEQLQHGLFTFHLLEGIKGSGDRDGNGKVGVAELFEYVAEAVEKDAKEQFGRLQRPWHYSSGRGGVYISAPRKTIPPTLSLTPVPRPGPSDEVATTIQEIERRLPQGDASKLVPLLRQLGKKAEPASIPVLFRCLTNASEAVRESAHKAVHAIGWDKTTAVIESLARQADEDKMGAVLEGLAAIEAHPQVVTLVDRLTLLLTGTLRNRSILLLERKRLGLERERISALFREKQSPYQIERVLGQGLFTAAYLAHHEEVELKVVVRVLRPEFVSQPHVRAGFLDLSKRSVHFIHHNLVVTRDVRSFPDRHIYYTVRDYIDGVTLQKLLESGKRFEPLQIVKILCQLLEALTPVHRSGASHGGINPSNIYLGRDDRAILGDPFLPMQGIAVALERLSYDYRYAPPEMFRSGGVLGPRSDFYALGCVAYELMCGEPPFVSDNHFQLAIKHDSEPVRPASQRGSQLGRAGDAFLQRLLAKAVGDRFADLDEALRALDLLYQTLQPQAPPDRHDQRTAAEATMAPPPAEPSVPLLHEASLIKYDTRQSVLPFSESGFATDSGAMAPERPGQALQPPPEQIGRYRILGMLGQGGMGVVYKARDTALNRLVALKMVQAAEHAHPETVVRFHREAVAVAQLQHPNIVQIYDVGVEQGQSYFALEFVEGGSLAHKWRREAQPAREAAHMLEILARAVGYAHERGILHRDLKPANVLLRADGTPKITDFGLAKVKDQDERAGYDTSLGTVMGTPVYMSPEQFQGQTAEIGRLSDVYALGVMLYEGLTGRPPFWDGSMSRLIHGLLTQEAPPPSRLQPTVPPELDTICLKCLQKDPAQRYASAEALAEDLRRFLAGESLSVPPPPVQEPAGAPLPAPPATPGDEVFEEAQPIVQAGESSPARPPSPWERGLNWVKGRPTLAALCGIGGLVLLALLGALWWYFGHAGSR